MSQPAADDWPFADPRNVAVITTRQVFREGLPVLLVTHDEDDGDWQFVCGTTNELGDDCVATPAIAGNAIFVRTRSALWSFGEAAQQ